jgi:hypothetical protein
MGVLCPFLSTCVIGVLYFFKTWYLCAIIWDVKPQKTVVFAHFSYSHRMIIGSKIYTHCHVSMVCKVSCCMHGLLKMTWKVIIKFLPLYLPLLFCPLMCTGCHRIVMLWHILPLATTLDLPRCERTLPLVIYKDVPVVLLLIRKNEFLIYSIIFLF